MTARRSRPQSPEICSIEDAVSLCASGDSIYLHEVAMTPFELIDALAARILREDLTELRTVSLHTEGPAPHVAPELEGRLRHNALFVGANVRDAVNSGRADYTPVFLSDIPSLIANGSIPVDVAFLHVSPPDNHGFCRLGTSVACARAASEHARHIVALVNPQVPRTMGNTSIHMSKFAAMTPADRPLPTRTFPRIDAIATRIGEHVASLIPDGATIQVGIGAIPDAVLSALHNHIDLGVHTEMFSDGLLDLIEGGVVSNRYKNSWNGRIVTSFVFGSQRLYDYVDSNPFIEFHSSDIVNDTREIRRIDRMMSINSAIEIDLTGQVVADSIGSRIYSGIGGQMDFARGAALAHGGKAIFALPSTAAGGSRSRIVSNIQPGAGVVTTRGHVQYVVTEYGIANLVGKSLRERAELLSSIAHPDYRSDLLNSAAARTSHLAPSTTVA